MKPEQNGTPARYPRTYEIGGRRTLNGIAVFCACFGVVGLGLSILTHPDRPIQVSNAVTPVVTFLVIGSVWAWWANQRVILHEDAIELTTWFSRRTLTRDQIAGYRIEHPQSSRGGIRYIIAPRSSGERIMKLPRGLLCDKPFHAWMKRLEQIDQAE